jgi:transcription antitermination factor NusG
MSNFNHCTASRPDDPRSCRVFVEPRQIYQAHTPGQWFIIQTIPGRDLACAEAMHGRAYLTYAPIIWKTVRGEEVRRPLIPGYFFVASNAFPAIQRVPGVRDFLRVLGTPASLPERAIEAVREQERALEEERQYHIRRRTHRRHDFIPGQHVRFTRGSFCGLFSKIEALDGYSKILLLLDMFGRATRVVVHPSEIEAA